MTVVFVECRILRLAQDVQLDRLKLLKLTQVPRDVVDVPLLEVLKHRLDRDPKQTGGRCPSTRCPS